MKENNNIYDFLVNNNLTTKSKDEFDSTYSDKSKQLELYDFFKNNNLTTKTPEEFSSEYFSSAGGGSMGKSVEPSESLDGVSQFQYTESPNRAEAISQVAQSIPKEQPRQSALETKEDPYFTGMTKMLLESVDKRTGLGIGDFIDDMARAWDSGRKSGAITQDAMDTFIKGSGIDDKTLQSYADAHNKMKEMKPSDEMVNFQRVYEKEGEGIYGFMKGLWENPSVAPEIVVNSLGALANETSLKAGGAIVGTSAAAGLATGGGAIVTGAASIPFAMGAMSATLETGMTFTELLGEEIDGEWTKEKVRDILGDSEKMNRIRAKAAARGIVIGTVDALTAKLAGSVGARVMNGTISSKVKGAAAASAIESVGGGIGEIGGSIVIGETPKVIDVGMEMIGELPMTPIDIASAALSKETHKINGQELGKKEFTKIINAATPEEIMGMSIELKNSPELEKVVAKKTEDAAMTASIKDAIPNISEEDLANSIELESQLAKLKGNDNEAAKNKSKIIKERLAEINNKYLQPEEAATTQRKEVQEKTPQEEVSDYIAQEASRLSLEQGMGDIESRMDNAEYINDQDIESAQEVILGEMDRVENSDYSESAKNSIISELEETFDKLEGYEFRTKTETKTVIKKDPTQHPKRDTRKVSAEEAFDGTSAILNGEEAVKFENKGGRVVAKKQNGEEVVFDTPSAEVTNINFDENGNLNTIEVSDSQGNTFEFGGETAMDFAIKDRQNKIGEVPEDVFNSVLEEEQKKVETPYIKEQKTETDALQQVQRETEESVLRDKRMEETSSEESQIEQETKDDTKPSDAKKVNKPLKTLEDWSAKLEEWDKDLTKFGNETMGINLPVAVAQAAVKAAKVAVAAGKTAVEVYQAMESAVKNSEWYKGQKESVQNKSLKDLRNFTEGKITAKDISKAQKKRIRPTKKKISNKVKTLVKKLKGGKFYNRSLEVANFLGSLNRLGQITDESLLSKIESELASIGRSVADIQVDRLNRLTQEILDYNPETSEKSPKERVKSKLDSLKRRKPKDIAAYTSKELARIDFETELDNALTNGSITEDEYNDYLEELSKLDEAESKDIQDADSYTILVRNKGNITRAKNAIKDAYSEGRIDATQLNSLLDGLDLAKKKLEKDAKGLTEGNNKKTKSFFNNNTARDISEEFNLTKPQTILLEKLFDVFKRFDVAIKDPAFSERMFRITEAISNGYFPLKDIYSAYRSVFSDINSKELVGILEKSRENSKHNTTAEWIRDFGATTLGFRSGKLGKYVKDSKALERKVYAPLVEAIEQSNKATEDILNTFDKSTKFKFWDKLNPLARRNRRRNIMLAGVYMNQLGTYIQRGEGKKIGFMSSGDKSSFDLGSADWLGIILGKEAALNALNGKVDPTTRKAITNGMFRDLYGKSTFTDKLRFLKSDADVLNDIWESLPKLENGSVDWDYFFNNVDQFLPKEAQDFIKATNEANAEAYEYAQAAKMIRGEKLDNIVAYYKRARFGAGDIQVDYRTMNTTPNMRVVAGSSINRTTDNVGAIDFNVINTVVANAIEMPRMFNFEINGGLVNSTLGKTEANSVYKPLVRGIKGDAKASLTYNFAIPSDSSFGFINKFVGAQYAAKLLKVGRLMWETLSMMIRAPFQTGGLRTYADMFNPNVRSRISQLEELSGVSISPSQTAQYEQGSKTSGLGKRGRNNLSAMKGKGIVDLINIGMSIPEISVSAGFSYPLFLKNFELITGSKFDADAFGSNQEYRDNNKQAITESMSVTNIELDKVFAIGDKFGTRRQIKIAPLVKKNWAYIQADTVMGRLVNYMSTFVFKEGVALKEAVVFTKDAFKEDGFKAGVGQLFLSKETAVASGVVIGGMAYAYLRGMEYLLMQATDDEDDKKRDEAEKILKETYGLEMKDGEFVSYNPLEAFNGISGLLIDQMLFYGIGGYGQPLRLTIIGAMSVVYDHASDKPIEVMGRKIDVKKEASDFLRNKFYTKPISFNKFGLNQTLGRNIPAWDITTTKAAAINDTWKDVEKLSSKDNLTKDEEMRLTMSILALHTINMGLMFKGTQIPESRAIEKYIRGKMPKKSKILNKNGKEVRQN